MAKFVRIESDWVVFVNRLAVDHWFWRRAIVIDARLVVAAGEFHLVAVLAQVEVQPSLVVKPLRRAGAAGWVKGD